MNRLISLNLSKIGDRMVRSVNGRDLHKALGVKKDFSSWIKQQVKNSMLDEHSDFEVFTLQGENPTGGRFAVEYALSIEAAKHIAMMSRCERGKRIRQYFIEIEQRHLAAAEKRATLSWQQARLEGKVARKELVDVVARFVDYASAQGSSNARHYFQNITKMTYKALSLVKETSPKQFRDILDSMQLSFLSAAEYICQAALEEGMKEQMHYKDIYLFARVRVTSYAATLPKQKLLTAV